MLWYSVFPLVSYLGTQIVIINIIGLWFLGSGQKYSVDDWLMRLPVTRILIKLLYFPIPDINRDSVAKTRFMMITMYWGISIVACVFHILDRFWWQGKVLQLALVTPYLSDHYALFNNFADDLPAAYNILLSLALGVQVFWEVALLPLMYWKWGARFAAIQGFGFFLCSLIFLNLGYLPYFEFGWWVLIFSPVYMFSPNKSEDIPSDEALPSYSPRIANRTIGIFAYAILAIVLFFASVTASFYSGMSDEPIPEMPKFVHSFIRVIGLEWSDKLLSIRDELHQIRSPESSSYYLFRAVGQGEVNVFNRNDLNMGNAHMVISELDDQGNILRVVPFMDIEGGRLDYLRNDLLYFYNSLPWQRNRFKFTNTNDFIISNPTLFLFHQVVKLDSLLSQTDHERYYRAYLFYRTEDERELFIVWNPATPVLTIDLTLSREAQRHYQDTCQSVITSSLGLPCAYNLLPGHYNSTKRLQETREALENLQPQVYESVFMQLEPDFSNVTPLGVVTQIVTNNTEQRRLMNYLTESSNNLECAENAVVFIPRTDALDYDSYLLIDFQNSPIPRDLVEMILSRVQQESSLNCNDAVNEAFANWRTTKLPGYLQDIGIEYMFVGNLWRSNLSPEDHQIFFESPENYEIVLQAMHPSGEVFSILRVVGDTK